MDIDPALHDDAMSRLALGGLPSARLAVASTMLHNLPLVSLDEVFHVGTLNIDDRADWSYEGDGLSVSIHPDEWAQIAKLGRTTWVIRKPEWEDLTFVSWHDLSSEDRDALRQWAHARGWVEQRQVFRVSWEDADWHDTVSMDFDSEPEACVEAEFRIQNEDTDARVEPVTVWRPTATFPESRTSRDADPTDVLLAVYVRETRPDLDGVWWDDDFDPEGLSCPRGVLVHDLSRYQTHQC